MTYSCFITRLLNILVVHVYSEHRCSLIVQIVPLPPLVQGNYFLEAQRDKWQAHHAFFGRSLSCIPDLLPTIRTTVLVILLCCVLSWL